LEAGPALPVFALVFAEVSFVLAPDFALVPVTFVLAPCGLAGVFPDPLVEVLPAVFEVFCALPLVPVLIGSFGWAVADPLPLAALEAAGLVLAVDVDPEDLDAVVFEAEDFEAEDLGAEDFEAADLDVDD
jgi:hypothetical protein